MYNERKQELQNILLDCEKLKKNLYEGESFKVLICGPYSCGKSTFLNALIGLEVFPSNPLKQTATFCEVVHHNKD